MLNSVNTFNFICGHLSELNLTPSATANCEAVCPASLLAILPLFVRFYF
jgi:hypothetical protein